MRLEARVEFERHYTGSRNYALLLEIYNRTIGRFHAGPPIAEAEMSAESDPRALVQIAS